MTQYLPRYVEEDFDDPELTQIFNEAEENKKQEKLIEKQKKEEYDRVLRRFLRLNHDVITFKKDYDDATEIMLQVSKGTMTSKLSLSELKKDFKDKYFIMKNGYDELQKCKDFLSTF